SSTRAPNEICMIDPYPLRTIDEERRRMDNDDLPVGKVLSRRAVLALVGTGAGALGLGMSLADLSRRSVFGVARAQSALPTCVARPEMTEGPYYLDDQLDRSDIRSEPSDGSVVAG